MENKLRFVYLYLNFKEINIRVLIVFNYYWCVKEEDLKENTVQGYLKKKTLKND